MNFCKKIILALAVLCIWSGQLSYAQKDFTMQEAVLGLATHLAVENIDALAFRPGHDAYSYMSSEKALMYVDIPSGKEQVLLTLADIQVYGEKYGITFQDMPRISWLDAGHLTFSGRDSDGGVRHVVCQVSKSGNKYKVSDQVNLYLPAEAQNAEWQPEKKALAYTVNNNLYYIRVGDDSAVLIAGDEEENIIYGQSVHRNEFGISKGVFHSPQGSYVAFYRMDETMVADYPVINWSVHPAVSKNIKYPMAGGTSHQVTLGIYKPETGQTIYVNTGEPKEQYLTCVTWDPTEEYIYIAVLNRSQNHMKLNQYSAATGAFIKTLFEESHPKYVEPQHALYFLPGGKEFVWMSQRDGYMHAYLYNKNGEMRKQLTKGDWLIKELKGADKDGKWLYFTSTRHSALGTSLNRVNVRTGKLDSFGDVLGTGFRTMEVSESGLYIIDNFRSPDYPRIISLINTRKGTSKTLLKSIDPLQTYNLSQVRNVTLKTDDGVELYGKLMLPHDFDSSKKYPVIIYLYNGPHVQLITRSFPESGNLWYDYMTQKGFIVWSMDGRGSANRGLDFEQSIHNNLGEKEAQDHMAGVNYLKSLPFIDAGRIGIHGWSYGGFMTTYMMTHYPDVFKAGAAGGPVIDWRMYEIMYTERYMSSPAVNGAGYDKNNLLNHASRLKGKLLMIHGADDDVVVWQHSMRFIKACVDNNIPIDYFVYPGHAHNVRGKDRIHLMQKISDYFIQNL